MLDSGSWILMDFVWFCSFDFEFWILGFGVWILFLWSTKESRRLDLFVCTFVGRPWCWPHMSCGCDSPGADQCHIGRQSNLGNKFRFQVSPKKFYLHILCWNRWSIKPTKNKKKYIAWRGPILLYHRRKGFVEGTLANFLFWRFGTWWKTQWTAQKKTGKIYQKKQKTFK